MKRTISAYYTFLLIAFSAILGSCKKFVSIDPAPDMIGRNAVFQQEKTALSATSAVYAGLGASSLDMTSSGITLMAGLSADELQLSFSNEDFDGFYLNAIPTNNPLLLQNFWTRGYKIIYQINVVLEGISASEHLDENFSRQIRGEMLFLRGWCYLNLSGHFGDVPLLITTDYRINMVAPRTARADIYKQIVSDLEEAVGLLGENYPSDGKARPNKWTAVSLLARVYLYTGEWEKAAASAGAVIGSSLYSLPAELNSVFLINSPETIWEIAPPNERGSTGYGQNFIPYSPDEIPAWLVSPSLLSAFKPGDLRWENWIVFSTVDGTDYYYPFKYKSNSYSPPVTEYNVVFRLAEQYLIRAEALIHLNRLEEAAADLNVIRARAGLDPTILPLTQEAMTMAVEQERRIELFAEWGQRWQDLRRTGRAGEVLTVAKGIQWNQNLELYPIPFAQLQYNPFLTQNPGY